MNERERAGAPPGLVAETFEVAGEEFAVLEWSEPVPRDEPVLSAAERDVVELLREGLSNADIAHRRHRSARTVANQVASIFRKLGVGSRLELFARTSGARASTTGHAP